VLLQSKGQEFESPWVHNNKTVLLGGFVVYFFYMKMDKITFADQVRAVVRSIPRGQTMSYGDVARLAGHPGAARAVGSIMRNNFDTTVPCHRVIRADGTVGAYNRGGSDVKRALLQKEKQHTE
jgi:methylated-DNA-[protein]-cysteine S-methyltransferase